VVTHTGHDAMHDLLEGCVRVEIRRLLSHLHSQGIKYDKVDDFIQSFPYGRNDRPDKPSMLCVSRG
ncbi:hypothetical protein PFISCL1PPCAC_9340, partial [Pristionchus fissidentatus]